MTLLEKYIIARWCYAVGEDFISDMEYRHIEDELKSAGEGAEYINRSWSDDPCPMELLKKYGMEHLIRHAEFIHKSESIESINTISLYKEFYRGLNVPTDVSMKIDGWNTQVNYYNGKIVSANTRGRSGNFMDASVVMEIVPQEIPLKGKVKVTGESSIPKSKWERYKVETGNSSQRNSVSTAFANKDKEVLSFLAFNIQADNTMLEMHHYDLLSSFGFKTPMRLTVNTFDGLESAMRVLSKRNAKYDFLTDGVVVQNEFGQKALRIYEWEEKSIESYVTHYIENRGSYGISMVAGIYPVLREGITRSKVSVTNIKYIVENNLRIGAPIAFDVRSSADAVLNTTKTMELQLRWENRFDEYRAYVEERERAGQK